jgi:hypothetical protein
MPPAPVPETPVHEHGDVLLGKDEVRFAGKLLISPPAGNAVLTEQFRQHKLRVLVAAPPNPRHHFGTFSLGEDIGH